VIYALRIKGATLSFVGEGDVFILERGGGVNVDKYRSSTVQFESADLCNG